jgi:prepilin-type N-terminal cleavage/methylation domain-containing protein
MRRQRRAPAGRARAYTLIELLVVMGIITLLAALTLSAINHGLVVVHTVKTANIIHTLSVGLERFYKDWSVYPPSDSAHGGAGGKTTGTEFLAYYLMGPDGKGWVGAAPFGSASTSDRWGPYFQYDGPAATVVDAFNPGKPIFYFRAERGETNEFDVADNPTDTSPPPDEGFANQAHLNLLVKRPDPADPSKSRWLQVPYLLISPGPDRFYGYVKKDASGNMVAAAQADVTSGLAVCDDITNFSFK